MSVNFYNKVAKRFGGYSYGTNNPKYTTEYPEGIPENDFKEKLIELSGSSKVVLDVGCGDCRFAFSIAGNFKAIVGVDNSTELLKVAKSKQKELKIKNVRIFKVDANHMKFENESFEIAFSRRGPTPYKDIYKILKSDGYFVIIGIGEKDCVDIKEVFGRGQNFGGWNKSVQKKVTKEAEKLGFKTIFSKDYYYDEYYESYQDLDLFLQGVPIFEDFDSEKDRKSLEKYTVKFRTKKGIKLPRHRVVFVFQKQ